MANDMADDVGTIEGLCTTPGSGIAHLLLRGNDGHLRVVLCDAAPTMRALSNLAPSLMRGGASVRIRLVEGLRVRYCLDELGLLESIGPDEDDEFTDTATAGGGR